MGRVLGVGEVAGGAPAHHSSPMGVQLVGWQMLRCSWVVSCIVESLLLGMSVVVALGSGLATRVVVAAKHVEVLKQAFGW